jgi:hypothetical protein
MWICFWTATSKQLQWYITNPIHLKNDTNQNKDKNNYNNNEHKQNTTEGENYLQVHQFDCYKLKQKFVIVDLKNASIFILNICNSIQGSHK